MFNLLSKVLVAVFPLLILNQQTWASSWEQAPVSDFPVDDWKKLAEKEATETFREIHVWAIDASQASRDLKVDYPKEFLSRKDKLYLCVLVGFAKQFSHLDEREYPFMVTFNMKTRRVKATMAVSTRVYKTCPNYNKESGKTTF